MSVLVFAEVARGHHAWNGNTPTIFTYGCAVRFADVGGETANMGERDGPMFCRLRRQNIGKLCGGCGAAMGPGVEKPQATVTIAFGENAPGAGDGRGR